MDMIYLDHAAATPLDPVVLAAMQPYFSEQFYNPSATYQAARSVADAVQAARARVAHYLGSRPTEIVFTAGGSEANNVAIHGVMAQYPAANLIIASIEHDSVLQTAKNYDCRYAAVDEQGIVDLESLPGVIDDNTVLLSIMYANNEIGVVQPLRRIAATLQQVRDDRRQRGIDLPLYLHTDAAQAGNYLDLHAARLGVDMMTLNGGKLYGPKQTGALYVRAGVQLAPLIHGGGQERGLRSGTENVAGIIGFAKALEIAQSMRNDESRRLQALQRRFIDLLRQQVPEATINGSMKYRLPNNVHVTVLGQDNERLLFGLDEAGVMAAAGSACSASSEEASHVLAALGMSDEAARASLRFTTGRSTTEAMVERTVRTLAALLA